MTTNTQRAVSPNGGIALPSSSDVHAFIEDGCNVTNGTIVGAAVGAALFPVPGGPELGAAIGGWIGSQLREKRASSGN